MGRCIVCTGIRLLLLIRPFISSFFFLSNFQTLKFFVTLFSGTVRPRRLKLCKHVDSGWIHCVYRNQAAAACLSLYFTFYFLSNFQILNIFVTLFSGTVRPWRLKLGTHVDSGQMYRVFRNQIVTAYLPFYFSFFFLSSFQTLKFSSHFSQELWGLQDWNLGTHGQWMNGCGIRLLLFIRPFIFSMFFLSSFQTLKFLSHFSQELWGLEHTWTMGGCIVYTGIRLILLFVLLVFIFLSFQFSNIKTVLSHFSQELWGLECLNFIPTWTMSGCIVYTGIWLLLYICLFIIHFSLSPIFKHWNFLAHFSQELWGLEGWNLVHTWTMGGCIVYTERFYNIFLQNYET